MSRIGDEIKAEQTNTRAIIQDDTPDFLTISDSWRIKDDIGYIYKIGMSLYSEYAIHPSEQNYVDEVTYATKRRMIEYIFGEFREPIHKIRTLIYQRNYMEAITELSKLERNMFE